MRHERSSAAILITRVNDSYRPGGPDLFSRPTTNDYEKNNPLRSFASKENSFTEVEAGSETYVAVSV